MIFPSNILTIFGRHNGTLAPEDGVLLVPPAISPVVEIPEPQVYQSNGANSTLVHLSSFITSVERAKAASQIASSDTVCLIGPGLWRINVWGIAEFTFSDLGVAGIDVSLVNATSAYTTYLHQARPLAGSGVFQSDRILSIQPSLSLNINLLVAATGVSQTMYAHVCVTGSRLG